MAVLCHVIISVSRIAFCIYVASFPFPAQPTQSYALSAYRLYLLSSPLDYLFQSMPCT